MRQLISLALQMNIAVSRMKVDEHIQTLQKKLLTVREHKTIISMQEAVQNITRHYSFNTLRLVICAIANVAFLMGSVFPTPVEAAVIEVNEYERNTIETKIAFERSIIPMKSTVTTVDKEKLIKKYQKLAGPYYYDTVLPYLADIDTVLVEKGYDTDANLVKAMFYIGQHESHWNIYSVGGGGLYYGIFQFMPGTFRSVSDGDIFNAQDQIRAFVTMVERHRVDEYGTLYIGTLDPSVVGYVLNF